MTGRVDSVLPIFQIYLLMALQNKYDVKLIIYMNQNNNNMTLELTISEITQLKSLIFDEVWKVGGFDNLNPLLYDIIVKIISKKTPEVL